MLSCIAWWGPSQFKCRRNHGITDCKHSRGGWSVHIFTWNFRGYGWTIKWCSQPQDAKWHDRRCWGTDAWWTRRCWWRLELCLRSCISCGFNGKKEWNRSGVGCSQPVILLHMRSMSINHFWCQVFELLICGVVSKAAISWNSKGSNTRPYMNSKSPSQSMPPSKIIFFPSFSPKLYGYDCN